MINLKLYLKEFDEGGTDQASQSFEDVDVIWGYHHQRRHLESNTTRGLCKQHTSNTQHDLLGCKKPYKL